MSEKHGLSEKEELKKYANRNMLIVKSDEFLQKTTNDLTLQEQRFVYYAMSKIQPGDAIDKEYSFDLGDFCRDCGLQTESYTHLKKVLDGIDQKSWWMLIDDNTRISKIRWFRRIVITPKSGAIAFKFHEDLAPHLFNLKEKLHTGYSIVNTLAMKSRYSRSLYEILKSYQKNNMSWFFEVDKLRQLLNAKNYTRWNDFRVKVLDPAVSEINKYSDIQIRYEIQYEGRKVSRVTFRMGEKSEAEIFNAMLETNRMLDGKSDLKQEDILCIVEEDTVLEGQLHL